ncbi:MAG TPA: TIGR03862 family flavoprotein, partial [Turneriella sp.]|nr:TIGR03862 family flavoprotein [Turneriella sp.]
SAALEQRELILQYKGDGIDWDFLLQQFSVTDWLHFIERLGFQTYKGTSRRYFIREMKAGRLLKVWLSHLKNLGCEFFYRHTCTAFAQTHESIALQFSNGHIQSFSAVIFALGGASALPTPAAWPQLFEAHGVHIVPFAAANVGYNIAWKKDFIAEAANTPLKNIEFISPLGRKKGDIMITEHGIEGTPVYFYGTTGACHLDLKIDLTAKEIEAKLSAVAENLSPLRRAQKILRLNKATQALLFHEAPREALNSISAISQVLKKFPLRLENPRPLEEAISSTGGIALDAIDSMFMLKKTQGVFVVGEMLDWSAPTGGFLIQACVAQGHAAAQGVINLKK